MTIAAIVKSKPLSLSERWAELKTAEPNIRIRNAAQQLGVSELELLLTRRDDGVTLLEPQFANILIDLEKVGPVMALSRNEQVVHERHGIYTDFKVNKAGNMGLCLGEIDLRTFFSNWSTACSVNEPIKNGLRKSIQFFDIEGNAIHKVYLTDRTDPQAWDQLKKHYAHSNPKLSFKPALIPEVKHKNSGQVSPEDVRKPWSELKDVHHFHAMLRKLGIDRLEALQLVGQDYAVPLSKVSIESTLKQAAEQNLEIMVFVGNGHIVQIHTGPVKKLVRTGPWFNVLDPEFNLHLNTVDINHVWLVKRPSSDGTITSIECFNARRELVLTLFGARKPGQPELKEWQKLTSTLEPNL